MPPPPAKLAFIGFGEAGAAFASGMAGPILAYDRKTKKAATRDMKLRDYVRCGATAAETNRSAVAGAPLVLSLVTADKALAAARETARGIAPGALFCDMNSVAPDTKRAAAALIDAAGGRYVDIAVMAPVQPQRRAVPLLVAGPPAREAAAALAAAGFGNVRIVGTAIGDAAAIKMLRSVVVKGIEALTTECLLAADRAGVLGEVMASLDASWPGADWSAKADYNLERMMRHGARRAEEMAEVVRTLEALGAGSAMSRATAKRQAEIARRAADADQTLTDAARGLRPFRDRAA